MKKTTMKKRILAAALAAGCFCCCTGLTALAVTVDDVAQKAREVGYSEDLIQMGYNEWATGNYTQADLEEAYAALCAYDQEADDKIDSIFNTESSTDTGTTTEPDRTGSESDTSSSQTSTGSTSSAAGSTSSTADSTSSVPAETTPANTVTSADFINMTLDEKIAYVNSMSPEDKENFLNNLSTEERNSIIKQMSLDDKAQLMQGYVDAAQKMNMNIVVDSLSDDGIAVTVRDNEGIVIDKASVGITIDETGISYTGLILTAAAAVVFATAGIALLYRYVCRTDEQAQ